MKSKFIMVLVIVTACILGWTVLHYQFQENRQFRLQQIPGIPIYVYMEDDIAMDSLAIDLFVSIPEIDSLAKESGAEAAEELLQEYELGIEPGTLDQYSFPSVMTLTFKPRHSSLGGRKAALEMLAEHEIPDSDIDKQELAWGLLEAELDYLGKRWAISTLYTAILFFLMLLFARRWLYLAQGRTSVNGQRPTLLEKIRKKEVARWQNAMLILLPMAVNVVAYLGLVALGSIQPLIDWIFFGIQFVSVLAAILISAMLESARERMASAAHSITVDVPSRNNAQDS
ncbi:MAG: hypothetical protein ACP5F3_04255 [Candidatus Syntrophosphaera sp.]